MSQLNLYKLKMLKALKANNEPWVYAVPTSEGIHITVCHEAEPFWARSNWNDRNRQTLVRWSKISDLIIPEEYRKHLLIKNESST